jgi:hypothetical protein
MFYKYTYSYDCVSWVSSLNKVPGYVLRIWGLSPCKDSVFFVPPLCPDLLSDPMKLLLSEYHGQFPLR